MSLGESGADIVVELSSGKALRVFENLFRTQVLLPPLSFKGVPNPINPSQILTMKDVVPRFASAALRQEMTGGTPRVFIDMTLGVATGELTINGAQASAVTLPIELVVEVSSGMLTIRPQLLGLAAFVSIPTVSFPVDLLASGSFSAVPIAAAVKLVGPERNLAVGLDVDLKGTLLQFSGDCPKKENHLPGFDLNGPNAADLGRFRTGYDTALISAADHFGVAIAVDEAVLAAKLRTLSVDRPGMLEKTRVWLSSAGPTEMQIGGQGCVYYDAPVVSQDWWDAGWSASARLVPADDVRVYYKVDKAFLTDTDSNWNSCIDAMKELKDRGLDKGSRTLGVSSVIGKDTDPVGAVEVAEILHRQHDAVFRGDSSLPVLSDPIMDVTQTRLVFGPMCSEGANECEVLITNVGIGAPLQVAALRIENDPDGVFQAVGGGTPFTIGPSNASATRTVAYTGATGKNHNAELVIFSNAGKAVVTLEALMAETTVLLPPAFDVKGRGKRDICTAEWRAIASKTLTLTNAGPGALRVCSIAVQGDQNQAFSATASGQHHDWWEPPPPYLLEPGETLDISVTYAPPTAELGRSLAADLQIRTTAGDYHVALSGTIDPAYDFSNEEIVANFYGNIMCGTFLYEPKEIPEELLLQIIGRVDPVAIERNAATFLNVSVSGAPRGLELQLRDSADAVLASAGGWLRERFIIFPCQSGDVRSIRFAFRPGGKKEASRFSIRGWGLQIVDQLESDVGIDDFAVSTHHLYATTRAGTAVYGLTEGRLYRAGFVGRQAERASTVAVIRDQLLFVTGSRCEVFRVQRQDEHVLQATSDIAREVHALCVPVPAPQGSAGPPGPSASNDLVYAAGDELLALQVRPDGDIEVVHTAGLPEAALYAMTDQARLYLLGRSTLQVFDCTDPARPTPRGVFQSAHEVVNGIVIGGLGVLLHQGPSATLVDVTSQRPQSAGWYQPFPHLGALFPPPGRIAFHRRRMFMLGQSGRDLLVSRLVPLPLR